MNLHLDYDYGHEAEQFSFFRIPKQLFTDDRYSVISTDAKILYGILLDRMSLSVKNEWIDKENRVYIYYPLEEIMEYMKIGKDKGVKLFSELDCETGCGLIKRKKQGQGRPTIIYVMNFASIKNTEDSIAKSGGEVLTSEKPKSEFLDSAEVLTSEKPKSRVLDSAEVLTSEKPKSKFRKCRSLDFGKSDPNNTNINNTDYSNTESILSYQSNTVADKIELRATYEKILKKHIDFDCLIKNYTEPRIQELVDIMIDVICSKKESVIIGCEEIPTAVVKSSFLKLTYAHIEYVMECMKNTKTKICNIKSYLLASLYNAQRTIENHYIANVNYDLDMEE